jgi:molybdopterin-guanine dinucleotide biosynthesis protein A
MTEPARCTGVVLAGGRARRLEGRAKGLELVGATRIVDRVAAALRESADVLMVVANDPAAHGWLGAVRTVTDVKRGAGALGGLHAALTHSGTDVLVLAWDMPFASGALLRALREAGELHGADASVPVSRSPYGFEPLCAWYSARCLLAIEKQLATGDLRAGAWQPTVSTLHVDVSAWGDPDKLFFNVNTPDDLARANAMAGTVGE